MTDTELLDYLEDHGLRAFSDRNLDYEIGDVELRGNGYLMQLARVDEVGLFWSSITFREYLAKQLAIDAAMADAEKGGEG